MKRTKLTKHELKRQKDNLKRYNRFLPSLIVKKQQLQREVGRVGAEISKGEAEREEIIKGVSPWLGLLAEDPGLGGMIGLKAIATEVDNIAGVDIPVFVKADIERTEYDLFSTPLWLDSALGTLERLITIEARSAVSREQLGLLQEELFITTQRVNLFEKVKIPEARDAIRRISIYLGDQQTAAVGWARIAKKKRQVEG